ncbi:preprotein translocase subunit SecA [Sansalvadorimonas verongulae]|uniref:preprotein translocase subunit SecA n=1 Tax=Sansalvadorimonas verongulae TaxID=2172824 RepID=UPI0012BD7A80|nr:prepilin peptidase [Sansalvadorimonas verongulae]MTI15005.1 prepilin peptidase [Sansalvadorimonas verongulae]
MSKRPQRQAVGRLLRPERRHQPKETLEKLCHRAKGVGQSVGVVRRIRYQQLIKKIHQQPELALCENTLEAFKQKLRSNGLIDDLLIQAFAMVRQVAGRELGMLHFDSQLLAGLALLEGNIAEMQTGEGKTLTATLPAAAAGHSGIPVHVVTVNEYLARRDAELMEPVYRSLGLTVGCIVPRMSFVERHAAYSCDVVYCTNKDLVFDYLRDQLVLKQNSNPLHLHSERLRGNSELEASLLLRGLHFAVVDEADSVLLDEARSPLVISGGHGLSEDQVQVYQQALKYAAQLKADEDYLLDRQKRSIQFTGLGEERLKVISRNAGNYWASKVRREDIVYKALTAMGLLDRNHHYLIRDGKVQIIDEHTGRIMEDRSWEQGLHQLVELKEDCELTSPRDTLARMTYQRFFRQYLHLGGMTGTACEVRGELWNIYGLPVVKIPTHKPSKRQYFSPQFHTTANQKWQAVVDRIKAMHQQGRPVLVGVASVGQAQHLHQMLENEKIVHRVLSASHDDEEADIVACAGERGQVTVATQMAGRGTDISLSDEVEAMGGLHVILTEYHDSSRIDRQLAGRCARQGDAGSFEVIVSGEDSSITRALPQQYSLWRLRRAQKKVERRHAVIRRQVFRIDERQDERLAFVG